MRAADPGSEGLPLAALARPARRALPVAAVALALLAGHELALSIGARARAPIVVDVGPTTGGYLTGFEPSIEYPPVTARWIRPLASVDPRLWAAPDELTLVLSYAPARTSPTRFEIGLGDAPPTAFAVPAGTGRREAARRGEVAGTPFERFERARIALRHYGGPLELRLRALDEGEGPPLAVDWLRIEGARWSLPLAARGGRLLICGILALGLLAGCGLPRASLVAGVAAAAWAGWSAWDPFAALHAGERLALPCLLAAAPVAFFSSRVPGGRALALLFLASLLIRGSGLLHPGFFTPDVLSHSRYLEAFARAQGGLAERGRAAQVAAGVGYPKTVGERDYVFPYSPLFYATFLGLAGERERVETAMKLAATIVSSCELLAVHWLSLLVVGPRAPPFAALLALLLTPIHRRLFTAAWPAVSGHLFDVVAVAAAAALVERPGSRTRLGLFALAALAATSTYTFGLLSMTAFVIFLAALRREAAPRLLAATAVAVVAAVLLLYRDFAAVFFAEILPAAGAPAQGADAGGQALAWSRIPLFYGYPLCLLAVAGLALAWRRATPAGAALIACAAACLGLVALRGATGDLFQANKEILFGAPVFAVASALALDAAWRRGRAGRIAACALLAAIVWFCVRRGGELVSSSFALLGG